MRVDLLPTSIMAPFTKTIQIDVAANLGGPTTDQATTIVMAFGADAVSSNTPFTPAAWKYAYSTCPINCTNKSTNLWVGQGLYYPPSSTR